MRHSGFACGWSLGWTRSRVCDRRLNTPETPDLTRGTLPHGAELTRASGASLAAAATSILAGLVRVKIVALLLGPFGVGALARPNLFLNSATVAAAVAAGLGAVRALAAMRNGAESGSPP